MSVEKHAFVVLSARKSGVGFSGAQEYELLGLLSPQVFVSMIISQGLKKLKLHNLFILSGCVYNLKSLVNIYYNFA